MFHRLISFGLITAISIFHVSAAAQEGIKTEEVPNKDFGFSYAPDSGHAVFYSYRAGQLPDIYQRSPSGHDHNLTRRSNTWDIEPTFSPDGKHIIYSSGVDMASLSLRIMDADGAHDRVFYDGEDNEVAANWSPDGTMVMFSAFNNNERSNIIYLTDPKGQHVKALTADLPGESSNATWSADSRRIVFSNRPDENTQRDLYSINADGTNLQRLTHTGMSETAPIFLPNGREIMFVGQIDENRMQLYTMPVEGLGHGEKPKQISHFDETLLYFLTLKPSGKEVAFSKGDWTNGFSVSTLSVPNPTAAAH